MSNLVPLRFSWNESVPEVNNSSHNLKDITTLRGIKNVRYMFIGHRRHDASAISLAYFHDGQI